MSEVEAISFDEVECGKKVSEYIPQHLGVRSASSGDLKSTDTPTSWN
jgi:hypothetical protein